MSTTSISPPTTPAEPGTPPPSSPLVKVTLPTPPSFSARRNRAQSTDPTSPEKNEKTTKGHTRSVSFNLDRIEDRSDDGFTPKLYRIPQRTRPSPISPHSISAPPTTTLRRNPPRPLNLSSRPIPSGPISTSLSPFTRIQSTAPSSRFASTAAARGITIAPALSRGARHSISGTNGSNGSIWSAGLGGTRGTAGAAGWISPALGSARSVGTAARQRGLTVAVLKDGNKELIVGDVPVTPGLGTGALKSVTFVVGAPLRSAPILEEKEDDEDVSSPNATTPSEVKRKEIILCQYYHTPGLTCTSRPCRFVHNLDMLGSSSPGDLSKYDMKSPTTANDPTGGTFAQAQMKAQAKTLNIDELVNNGVATGETVVLANEDGNEVVGTVFLMSGGGKGPAGKSKAKYKTVPCKDFAEGHCPYGDYCSLVHDDKALALKTGTTPTPVSKTESDPLDKAGATMAKPKPATDAWTKAFPKSVLQSSVKIDLEAAEKHRQNPSAFAPPFLQHPVKVSENGELVNDVLASRHENTPPPIFEVQPATETEPKRPKSSAWSRGPPLSLKKVSIVEPLRTPTSASHLAPPVSAFSMFGTESDPATPWDPAMKNRMIEEEEEVQSQEYAFIAPPSYPSPSEFAQQVWNTPSYPWGMPLSPVAQPGYQDPLASIPGGPGVMWTPAGWAVQDAAMKHSLRAAEVKTKYVKTRAKQGKTYYKTRVCKFFLEGNCPHGDNCTYLHTLSSETSSEPDDKGPTGNIRTLPCKFFNSASGCTNGESCSFLHTLVPTSVPLVEKPRPWRTKPCRHYQLGRCTLGDACHFAHVIDPTRKSLVDSEKECRHWVKGRCEKGDDCLYKHQGGNGGGEEMMQLTEARLAMAFEEMRGSRMREEESDGEDDDVEIVTSATLSPARSLAMVV